MSDVHGELIQALKLQIDELTEQQSHAVRSAIYLVMSRKERTEYDQRQNKITVLIRQLRALEETPFSGPLRLSPDSP